MGEQYQPYSERKGTRVKWLGRMPAHWSEVRLKHVLLSLIDTEHKTAPSIENGIFLVCRTSNVRDGKLILDNAKYTDETVYREWTQRGIPEEGDILFTREAPAGHACLVPSFPPMCLGQRMVLFKLDKARVNTHFVLYSICSGLADEYITQLSQGSTVSHFNMGDIGNIPLFEPPLKEQICIANFLDHETAKIDTLIEKQKQLIELLKEKRQAVISHAVTKGLNPDAPMKDSGVEWLGEVPAHWDRRMIKQLFKQSKRQGYSDYEVLSVYREYGVIVKASRDDNNNKTPEDLSSYQLVEENDLVINKMKSWQGSLGVSDHLGITSPDYVVYSALHKENSRFIHYSLRARHMPDVYRSISNGIRPSQWRLEPEKFELLPVFLPPTHEQKEVADFLDAQIEKIEQLNQRCERSIELLQERRTALISAAVTGKIDVRDWKPPGDFRRHGDAPN